MAPRCGRLRVALVVLPAVLAGCFDEPPDRPNVVFLDAFEPGVQYEPFLNSKYDAVASDTGTKYAGEASMRLAVPTPGEPGAGLFNFSGGAITSSVPRDLRPYTALTFWARSSRTVELNSIGLANDNTGTSRYQTELKNLPLTPTWTRFVIPVPAPSKLASERGLLWMAAGASGSPPTGYRAWFDEIQYEALDASSWNPRPAITGATRQLGIGETYQIAGTQVTHTVDGVDLTQTVFPSTFDYESDRPEVASVSPGGLVTANGTGTAVVSAFLAGVPAPQTVTIQVAAGLSPDAGPTPPALAAADVISIYSDAYADVPVDNYGADWSNLEQGPRRTEVNLAGDAAQKYEDLLYVGIEFTGTKVLNVTGMTHFHVDAWTLDGGVFKVKLVDFGADGVSNFPAAGDDKESELTFNAGTSPALLNGQWVSFDLPLSSFTTLTTREHVAQIVLSSDTSTVFVDNIYFHK